MSEVKVNKITPRTDCGTTQLGDSGDTVTVTGDLRSNSLKAADGGVIISQSGTTITVGASGDTVSLASGASQSGFGRSGSVDWQTGSIKTGTFTAASGEGYFADTSSSAFTMNLPAGTAGAIVAVADYTRTFNTNNLTISPNGSQKIGGNAGTVVLNVNGQALTLVYVDDTEGWVNVQNAEDTEIGRTFISATGGTVTCSGNCKIHTFTGPGTFCVSTISTIAAENAVSYMVIAGGGAGGGIGAGGAGGFREDKSPLTPYTASPLASTSGPISITATAFPITVGGGGAGSCGSTGASGSNSIFSSVTSAGGGGGGNSGPTAAGQNGGSGGGSGSSDSGGAGGGAGNTPPVSPPQGQNGGSTPGTSPGSQFRGAGGGGAGGVGQDETTPANGSHGGPGVTTNIPASPITKAGGGGGGTYKFGAAGNIGSGQAGGGNGGGPAGACSATSATANSGSGGGGRGLTPTGHGAGNSGSGGSGLVVIRYKFQ